MKKYLYLILIIFLIFGACKKNSKDKNIENKVDTVKVIDTIVQQDTNISESLKYQTESVAKKIDTISKDTVAVEKGCAVFRDNKIPNPAKFKYAVKRTKPDFSILFSIGKKNKLANVFQKSLVLGVLSADLVYCVAYDNANMSTRYYKAAMELSDDLGISNVFSQKDFDIIRNFENKDSVKEVIKSNLDIICSQLNESRVYNELPFIIYGAWTESVYLLTNVLISNPDAPKKLFKELAKQKNIIEKLISYYNNILVDADDYKTNLNIQNIIGELGEIHDIFVNSLRENSYVMDKKQIKELKKAVSKIRNSIAVRESDKKIEQQQIQYQKNIEKK